VAATGPVDVRYRGQFAYVTGELGDGDQVPLMRLRYGGSAHRWGAAIYVASTNGYEDQIWLSGSVEEALDFVCDIHISPITPEPDPPVTRQPPKDFRRGPLRLTDLAQRSITQPD